MPTGQLSVCTMASCYNCCAHSISGPQYLSYLFYYLLKCHFLLLTGLRLFECKRFTYFGDLFYFILFFNHGKVLLFVKPGITKSNSNKKLSYRLETGRQETIINLPYAQLKMLNSNCLAHVTELLKATETKKSRHTVGTHSGYAKSLSWPPAIATRNAMLIRLQTSDVRVRAITGPSLASWNTTKHEISLATTRYKVNLNNLTYNDT